MHGATGSSLGAPCKYWDTGVPNVWTHCDGSLEMPKVKLDYMKDLTQTLIAMGMPMQAPLPASCGECALTQEVQKTYLAIAEKGTTAAAAAGGAGVTALVTPSVVDRPFAFAIIDH